MSSRLNDAAFSCNVMFHLYRISLSPSKDDSIQEQFECLCTQFLCCFVSGEMEPALLESLGDQEEAGAVPEHTLDVITATIHEQKQAAVQRILAKNIACNADEAIKLFAHIHWVTVGQNPFHVSRQHRR